MRLLIALFVARTAVTITEIAESQVTAFSMPITAAIGLEAWRAWRVRRAGQPGAARPCRRPRRPGTGC